MAYINRHIEQRITELSKTWSAILLTGPRQSGKTTMLKNLAEKENIGREYISLDDLTVREMAKNDPKMFLQLHKPPIIIDEVQYAPELFTYIKIHVDTYHNPGDFWLTGSQVFSLMKGVQESLAGRVALLHMSPLSQREIVGAQPRPFTTDFEALATESKIIKPLTTPESDIDIIVFGGDGFKKTNIFAFAEELRTATGKDVDAFEICEVNSDSEFYRNAVNEGIKIA